jgi:CRP/FNR family cyclic AMP-dependent transcriptional regulator
MIERLNGRAGFNPEAFLNSHRVAKRITRFEKAETIYSQGESCSTVLYINSGLVKLSAIAEDGKEGVIALLADSDFLGEACLSEAFSEHAARATAMEPTTVFGIQKKEMSRILREEPDFRNYFISYLLRRNARIEADLVFQLCNSTEKRLARLLLLLARPDSAGSAETQAPILAQETLADMIGTTRSRVNEFMNKFRRLGFIDYGRGRLRVHNSIVEGVLHPQKV